MKSIALLFAATALLWAATAYPLRLLWGEEALLFAKFMKGLDKGVRLALGPVPVVGEDDTYPKDRRGNPVQPVKFTIRAEKCPNKKGVSAVLEQFQEEAAGIVACVAVRGRAQLLGGLPYLSGLPLLEHGPRVVPQLARPCTAWAVLVRRTGHVPLLP